MDSLDNPQQFQNSSVVEKSSKTGIFSNKRLLVIKTGYLYYFSKVPKGYKSHVPNILTTFTDLPKSSIQIKNILDIRLQSAKSSNLIIKFYLKDMIDREDIRKSIDSQFYSMPNKKPNTETDEWKFMFTTVLQCRLWYNALMKLKDYFKNLEHKFSDFVAGFDKKRTSVSMNSGQGGKEGRSQSDIKGLVGNSSMLGGISSPNNSNSKNLQSASIVSVKLEQKRNTQPIKFDASKFITPLVQKHSSQSSQTDRLNQKSQISPIKYAPQLKQQKALTHNQKSSKTLHQQQQQNSSKTFAEQQQQNSQTGGYHPKISHKLQPQIPEHYHETMKRAESFMKGGLKESHLIEPIDQEDEFKMRQMEDDIREEVKIEIEQKVREQVEVQVRERVEREKNEEVRRYQQEVDIKERKIRQLQTEIHLKHLANMEQQRRIQEEKRQLQIKIIQEQEKLNHAKIDFQKQLKLQKIQNTNRQPNNSLKYHQQSNKKQGSQTNENRVNQRKWQQDNYIVDNEYEGQNYSQSYQQQYSQSIITQKPLHINQNLTTPTHTPSQNIHINQFSVQTDEQDFPNHNNSSHNDSFEPNFNFSKELSLSKDLNLSKQTKIRNSFFSDHGMTQRNILGNEFVRIQDGFSNELKQVSYNCSGQQFEGYDYFTAISKIYQQGITSQQKINRQVKLMNYLNYIKQQAINITLQYIAENNPTTCQTFQKGIFTFELACAPGKIMNIGGENKLIYSNKAHENLKRMFKTYQYLQWQIMKVLKSKSSFMVRVPLCTLIEYRGYTILARVEICTDQADLTTKDKYLKHLLPACYFSVIQLSKTIKSKDNQSQFYMIKALKPIKLTNLEKNSQLLKCQTDYHSLTKAIHMARNNNVSLSYEKLSKQYEEDKQSNEYTDQTLNSELQLLKVIKLMRQLKKIYKSMEPFDQKEQASEQKHINTNTNDHQNNKINKKRTSYFVQYLLSNPSELLSLIPSDTDLSTFNTRCGYFYSLLQFFLGIRVNQPLKQHSPATNVTYDILPVCRTYHFSSLSLHQHIDRVQKHLTQRNMQTAVNCLNLMKRISQTSVQPRLLEIKILLKQKQYAQAQDKIHSLREMLPLHDLRKIELNAYLIECYVFIGLESQVLKQIRAGIQYVEYMFGGKKNVFQTNLHLLMAETLLRLGSVNQAIKMYESLIKCNKVDKEAVLITYAQTLVRNHQIDPNQAIPFLLEFIDQITDSGKQIQLLFSVAKLYARTKRIDKKVYYLQKAFQLSLDSRNYGNLLELYKQLTEQTGSEQKRQQIFKHTTSQVDHKFWINQDNTKKFNTINLYQSIQSNHTAENEQMTTQISNIFKETYTQKVHYFSIEILELSRLIEFGNAIRQRLTQNLTKNNLQIGLNTQILNSINLELLLTLFVHHNQKLIQ